MTLEDWEELKENIQYDYIFDNHFTELKDNELLTERLNSVGMMEPYIGKYFSAEYIRNKFFTSLMKRLKRWIFKLRKKNH